MGRGLASHRRAHVAQAGYAVCFLRAVGPFRRVGRVSERPSLSPPPPTRGGRAGNRRTRLRARTAAQPCATAASYAGVRNLGATSNPHLPSAPSLVEPCYRTHQHCVACIARRSIVASPPLTPLGAPPPPLPSLPPPLRPAYCRRREGGGTGIPQWHQEEMKSNRGQVHTNARNSDNSRIAFT